MKNNIIEIIKDLTTSVLITICTIVVLSIFFYDKVSLSRVVPEAEEYSLSEEMEEELEEEELKDTEEIIVNYYIDASDLKKYEKRNEYNKGKSHPFAEASYGVSDENIVNGVQGNSSNNNFYKDEGIK